jgi:broad specificity phosphatase PhoE
VSLPPDALLLVRHAEVARAWRGRCYGQSDMGLSRAGASAVRALAPQLAAWRPDILIHSGLRRARILAEAIARVSGLAHRADPLWQEREFGSWEGRGWAAIYRESGNAMDGMTDAPAQFRPGGGETTAELAARAHAAALALPPGRVLVVTHGGPIAALIGLVRDAPVRDWPALVPPPGTAFELTAEDLARLPTPGNFLARLR